MLSALHLQIHAPFELEICSQQRQRRGGLTQDGPFGPVEPEPLPPVLPGFIQPDQCTAHREFGEVESNQLPHRIIPGLISPAVFP